MEIKFLCETSWALVSEKHKRELGGRVPQAAAEGIFGEGMIQDAQGLSSLWSDACPGGSLQTLSSQEDGKRQFQHGIAAFGSSSCASPNTFWGATKPTGDISDFLFLKLELLGFVVTEASRDLEAEADFGN